LVEAGGWIREHPDAVPSDSRILTWFPWELRVTSDRTTVLFPRSLQAGSYEFQRIQEVIREYGVTHVLWGSFEPMPDSDPEQLGLYLQALRESLDLTDRRQIYESSPARRYPVRLYRLRGASP
jgi:hypothetical protein